MNRALQIFILVLGFTTLKGSNWVSYPLGEQELGTVTDVAYGHNKVWLVAKGALFYHNGFSLKAVQDSFLLNKSIQAIHLTDTGLYLGFMSHGIGFYHPQKQKAFAVYSPKQGYAVLPDLRIGRILLENDTSLWVQTHHEGLTLVHKTKPLFYNYPTLAYSPNKIRGAAIVSDLKPHPFKKDHFLITTLGGLFTFDARAGEYVAYFGFTQAQNVGANPNNGRELSLRNIQVVGHSAFLGTWAGGLIELDLRTQQFKIHLLPRPKPVGRLVNIRQQWQKDSLHLRVLASKDGIWDFNLETGQFNPALFPKMIQNPLAIYWANKNPLGTFYAGTNSLYLHAQTSYPWQEVLPDTAFTRLAEYSHHALVNRGKALSLGSNQQQTFLKPLPGSGYGWHSLGEGDWAFVERRAVTIWDAADKNWLELDLFWRKAFPFKGEIISSYANIGRKALYLGTAASGVYVYYWAEKRWQTLEGVDISRYWIKAFAQRDSSLCIANEQQLHFFKGAEQVAKIDLKSYPKLPKGAIISKIWWPHPDYLWVKFNRAGLVKINLKSTEVVQWIKPRDREEQNFYNAVFRPEGIFVATAKGLLWLNRNGERKLLGSSYGLGAIYQLSWVKDTLWFNHQGALWHWPKPQPEAQLAYFPEPRLQDFKIMGSSMPIDSGLTLSHRQNWLEWSAIPASFSNPGQGAIELKLAGFTSQWRSLEPGQSYSISNLQPGTYQLMGRSLSAEGLRSPSQQLMKVRILPAWYQTWWFLGLTILGAAALLYGTYRYRLGQLRAQQAIENKYLDELRSLEMRMLRVQMNPHFIFNALNSVRYFILKQDRKKASDYLTRFSKLLRFILNLSKMEQVTLADELQGIENYIQFEQIRFNQGFNFEQKLDLDIAPEAIIIQPMLIQPFLENAIWHGLMPLEKKGTLKLSIKTQQQTLHIAIDDNGVGRKAAGRNQNKAQKSYGLSITKERLEAMATKSGEEAHYTILDKSEAGRAQGTKVELKVPFKIKTP